MFPSNLVDAFDVLPVRNNGFVPNILEELMDRWGEVSVVSGKFFVDNVEVHR